MKIFSPLIITFSTLFYRSCSRKSIVNDNENHSAFRFHAACFKSNAFADWKLVDKRVSRKLVDNACHKNDGKQIASSKIKVSHEREQKDLLINLLAEFFSSLWSPSWKQIQLKIWVQLFMLQSSFTHSCNDHFFLSTQKNLKTSRLFKSTSEIDRY